jgi:hypothetical protein
MIGHGDNHAVELHLFFPSFPSIFKPLTLLIPFKMSNQKGVAENMLWGGRFTREYSKSSIPPKIPTDSYAKKQRALTP